MSERLIDSVCPQCERIGTTVRVVKNEDGFTKLSRLCKECGGEWTNTFDADWLAVAKIRRLEAEVERLRAEMRKIEYLDRPQVRGLPRRVTIQQIALDALAGGKDD